MTVFYLCFEKKIMTELQKKLSQTTTICCQRNFADFCEISRFKWFYIGFGLQK